MIPFTETALNVRPHAVYRIFGEHDRLLYVGRSCRPTVRISEHKRSAPWRAEFRRYELTRYSDKDGATVGERVAIETERPAHNRRPGEQSREECYRSTYRRAGWPSPETLIAYNRPVELETSK